MSNGQASSSSTASGEVYSLEAEAGAQRNPVQRVLLVDPLYHVHSIGHYRAALGSTGFEKTIFTLVTTVGTDAEARRVADFQRAQPRLTSRHAGRHPPIESRLQAWRHYGGVMQRVEEILRRESFDLVVYVMADYTLPFLAFRLLRGRFRNHYTSRVSGLLFREHGLRSRGTSIPVRLRAACERWLLGRVIRSGAFRKLSFLDSEAALRANAQLGGDVCGAGIDPIEIPQRDQALARGKLAVAEDDFVALLLGSIDERKGVLETLSILGAAPHLGKRLVIFIAGQVTPALREPLEKAVEVCRRVHRVMVHGHFVADEDLPDYFTAASCVLCPYKNFVASSGILLHGASCGKPALVSGGGVMEDAVRRYGFGEVVRLDDPAGFAASLQRLMDASPGEKERRQEGALRYARSMDARQYMRQFLTNDEIRTSLEDDAPSSLPRGAVAECRLPEAYAMGSRWKRQSGLK